MADNQTELSKKSIASIIQAALTFSNTVHWHSHYYHSESDLLCIHRFCSKMFYYVQDLKTRKEIIKEYVASLEEPTFGSVYLCSDILRAQSMFDQDKLGSDHLWYDLFSKQKKDTKFQQLLIRHYKKGIKSLFIKAMKNDEFLNNDELRVVVDSLHKHHVLFYNSEFPKFIEKEKVLLRVLMICIGIRHTSIGGESHRFSLTKSQFFEKMDPSKIYLTLSNIDMQKLNEEEVMTAKFFLKAHGDGFSKTKFYSFTDPNNSIEGEDF